MKNDKFLYDAINAIENDKPQDAARLIKAFLAAGTRTKKSLSVWDCVEDKKSTREIMKGVWYDPTHKVAVASDGHILMVSKREFREECEGKCVHPDLSEVDLAVPYPNWQKVMPTYAGRKLSKLPTMSVERMQEVIGEVKIEAKIKGSRLATSQ